MNPDLPGRLLPERLPVTLLSPLHQLAVHGSSAPWTRRPLRRATHTGVFGTSIAQSAYPPGDGDQGLDVDLALPGP